MSGDGNIKIDDILVRLNKIIGENVRFFYSYINPCMVVIGFVAFYLIRTILKKRKQSPTSCLFSVLQSMLVIKVLAMLISAPVLTWFTLDESKYSDYLEFKFCELFQRLTTDVPETAVSMSAFLNVQLGLMCIIFVTDTGETKSHLGMVRVVAGIVVCMLLGLALYVPFWFLSDFHTVQWYSLADDTTQKAFCMSYGKPSILKYKYYPRNVHIIKSALIGGPSFICTLVAVIVVCRWKRKITAEVSRRNRLMVDDMLSILLALIFFTLTDLLEASGNVFVSLIYGSVDMGLSISELLQILGTIRGVKSAKSWVEMIVILVLMAAQNRDFRRQLMKLGPCRSKGDSTMQRSHVVASDRPSKAAIVEG